MLSNCLKCRKNRESKNPIVVRTKNGTIMNQSKCAVFKSKNLKFLEEKQAKGVFGNLLGVKVPIIKYLLNTLF